ncbi:hypothetical protein C8J57DRAFT_1252101 [Mycena rebaudengoi]|nr:hypothetical protein C8J57DRAFT_1252101 [Mycena rebaudengoi]
MPVGQNFELQSTWGSHPRASAGEYGVWTSPGAQKKSRMAGETKRRAEGTVLSIQARTALAGDALSVAGSMRWTHEVMTLTMVWGRMTGRGWGGGAAGSGSGGGRGWAARVGRGALTVGCRGGGYWPCECSVLVAGRRQANMGGWGAAHSGRGGLVAEVAVAVGTCGIGSGQHFATFQVQAEKSARMLGTSRVARIGVRVARQVEINSVPAFLRERFLR